MKVNCLLNDKMYCTPHNIELNRLGGQQVKLDSHAMKAHNMRGVVGRISPMKTKQYTLQKYSLPRYSQPQTMKAHDGGLGLYNNHSNLHTNTKCFSTTKACRREGGPLKNLSQL